MLIVHDYCYFHYLQYNRNGIINLFFRSKYMDLILLCGCHEADTGTVTDSIQYSRYYKLNCCTRCLLANIFFA